jgi:hypothetical protein
MENIQKPEGSEGKIKKFKTEGGEIEVEIEGFGGYHPGDMFKVLPPDKRSGYQPDGLINAREIKMVGTYQIDEIVLQIDGDEVVPLTVAALESLFEKI